MGLSLEKTESAIPTTYLSGSPCLQFSFPFAVLKWILLRKRLWKTDLMNG